jgi:hypothetical protein
LQRCCASHVQAQTYQSLDFAGLDQAADLGARNPLLLVAGTAAAATTAATIAAAAAAAIAAAATIAAAAEASPETTSVAASVTTSPVSHCCTHTFSRQLSLVRRSPHALQCLGLLRRHGSH